jgi:predicted O-linked N-acetylglucosamine transferase (SPINDLY family)
MNDIERAAVAALVQRGLAHHRAGRLAAAAADYRDALARAPDDAEALRLLGTVHAMQGDDEEALRLLRRAAAQDPGNAKTAFNIGECLRRRGDIPDAIAAYRQALVLEPEMADAQHRFALALDLAGDVAAAETAYRQALTLDPDNARLLANFAVLLDGMTRRSEALALLRRAVAVAPDLAEAHANLGMVLGNLGEIDDAMVALARAAALRPEDAHARSQLVYWRRLVCDWRGLAEAEAQVLDGVARGEAVVPFCLFPFCDDPALQRQAAARHAATLEVDTAHRLTHPAPAPRPRLRIGYLSADFREHATVHLAAEFFERHDRGRFEVMGYDIGAADDSAIRQRVIRAFDRFAGLQGLDDRAAAERIHADGVDILVDLKGYTRDARSRILAFRPAPLSVNYLGYPGTTGAPFIDYILVDRFIVPGEQQRHFSEELVHLPHCYQVNDSRRAIAEATPSRAECGLPERGFVFCCFNNPYKLSPEIFDLWMRLLAAVPESVLWLLARNDIGADHLRREAAARGIDPARLVFAPVVAPPEHLARHRLADLFLDAFPCGAHTTASDALWAGLPVLTCAGRSFVSRVAGSLLRAVGLPELVTSSLADYESLALALARDPAALAELRRRLSGARPTTRLFDAARQTAAIESAFTEMWRIRASGAPPRGFAVPAGGSP